MTRTHALAIALGTACTMAACEGFDRLTDTGDALEPAALRTLTPLERAGRPEKSGRTTWLPTASPDMGLDEADRLIKGFARAETSRELDHMTAAALAIIDHSRESKAELMRSNLFDAYNRVSPAVKPVFTGGYQGGGPCLVDFDDPSILGGFPDDAQSTFTTPPHWVQPCGSGEIRVEPTVYNHYHLSYEDPTIDCIDLNTGRFGRGDAQNCTPLADPTLEPRYLGSHAGDEVIRIRFFGGGIALPFNLQYFANVDNEPVKVRYRKNGLWYTWNSLGGPLVWDTSAWATGVTEVLITNAGTSLDCGPDQEAGQPGGCPKDMTPFFVDDISIST